MYELTVESDFSASHLLEGYDGPCGRLHGHNYRVRVMVEGSELDDLGMVLDMRILKEALSSALAPLDHTHLNDLPEFGSTPPTAENIARYVFDKMNRLLEESKKKGVRIREVRVAESDRAWVIYRP
jgi:6-pyruvoyltetrahydropterin/6-carboxytetrahydropterin synthase